MDMIVELILSGYSSNSPLSCQSSAWPGCWPPGSPVPSTQPGGRGPQRTAAFYFKRRGGGDRNRDGRKVFGWEKEAQRGTARAFLSVRSFPQVKSSKNPQSISLCRANCLSKKKNMNPSSDAYLVIKLWTAHRDPVVFCQVGLLYTVGWCCIMTSGDPTLPSSPHC